MKTFPTPASEPARRGYAAATAIVFLILLSVALLNVAGDAQTFLKHRREQALRAHLVEYNMAVLRFRAERGRFPESVDELAAFAGGLRRIYPDPFTGKSDFALVRGGEKFFIVSASKAKSLGGAEYSSLTADVAGSFRPAGTTSFSEATGYGFEKNK